MIIYGKISAGDSDNDISTIFELEVSPSDADGYELASQGKSVIMHRVFDSQMRLSVVCTTSISINCKLLKIIGQKKLFKIVRQKISKDKNMSYIYVSFDGYDKLVNGEIINTTVNKINFSLAHDNHIVTLIPEKYFQDYNINNLKEKIEVLNNKHNDYELLYKITNL